MRGPTRKPINKRTTLFVGTLLLLAWAAPALAYEEEVVSLCREIESKIAASNRNVVAVVDFTDISGNVTELGRFLAEEFAIELGNGKAGLSLIDRNHLATLMKEHKLSSTGLIDQETARQLGRFTGVQAIVTGFLTPFGDQVRITVKVLDTESAALLASARGNIPKSATIQSLLERGIVQTANGGAQPAAPKDHKPTREVRKVLFELQACALAAQTIQCELLIQNNGQDRTLSLSGESLVYDDFGNEYQLSQAQLANSTEQLPYSWSAINKTLVYGVPIRAELTFRGVSPEATKISRLRLKLQTGDDIWETAEFREISLDASLPNPSGSIGQLANSLNGGAQPEGTFLEETSGIVQDETKAAVRDLTRKAWGKLRTKLLGKQTP